ncbi:hypothetical protein A3D78_07025 [Candidatus Gottesmanbacteria bacterium RIFCSPHIGHO2_02_FULL_39_14]|nr:MAG: hypothetical protein A3D78_07025 [Candidatus Gottesmanbacteria bacterium RIFCSPHIGHO2_02_FULL_39_14]
MSLIFYLSYFFLLIPEVNANPAAISSKPKPPKDSSRELNISPAITPAVPNNPNPNIIRNRSSISIFLLLFRLQSLRRRPTRLPAPSATRNIPIAGRIPWPNKNIPPRIINNIPNPKTIFLISFTPSFEESESEPGPARFVIHSSSQATVG